MTKEWKKHQGTILNLYKVQGKTLSEVMKIMETQYSFKASTRAYRSRFEKWDVRKYNKSARKMATTDMPTHLPHSGPARTLHRTENSRSPSIPMMIRSYSASLPSSSSVYTPELSYSKLKSDPYASSNSPDSSISYQQYYALPVLQNPQHVPFDRLADVSSHYQELDRKHLSATQAYRFIDDAYLRQNCNGPDEYDSYVRAFHTILENPMTPAQDSQRVQLFLMYIQRLAYQPQLNNRQSGGPNALELYIHNYVSRDSVLDFCQIVATFIRAGAYTRRVIPRGFADTVMLASQDGRLSNVDEAVRQHHRPGGIVVPTCAAVWTSACVAAYLEGDRTLVDAHLSLLPFTVSQCCEIDIHALATLLKR